MTANKKYLLIALAAAALCVIGFFLYISVAFPKVRCEAAKHLTAPEQNQDCVTCHTKSTGKITQDWQDSKHGVVLVKCVVCHGEPDGKGSVPFAAKPSPTRICVQCHEPSINRMTAKYGELKDCNSCHPNHQNPMHRAAYETKKPSDKTSF